MASRDRQPESRDHAAQIEHAAAGLAAHLDELRATAGESRRAELGAIAAAAVAHEVRNLLTPVRARLELALLGLGDAALVERSLREAIKGVERVGRAADAVLSVVSGRVEIGDGADVAEVTGAAGGWVETAGFTVKREVPAGVRVRMAKVALEQVMVNLLLNARAAVGNGTVFVRLVPGPLDRVVIEVQDRGTGAAGGLFGATGQAAVKRGGLGLTVCRHLVEAVGGSMGACSEVGVGTTVRIELPRMTSANKAAA